MVAFGRLKGDEAFDLKGGAKMTFVKRKREERVTIGGVQWRNVIDTTKAHKRIRSFFFLLSSSIPSLIVCLPPLLLDSTRMT